MKNKVLCISLIVAFNYVYGLEQPSTMNNNGVINESILDSQATILTSINNITDLKSLVSATYNINLTIDGRVLDAKKVYIDKTNITLKELLDYVQPYYKYKWYVENNKIIINTGVSNPKGLDTVNRVWTIAVSDKNLRNVFSKWCKENNWSLIWNAKYNYLVDANWEINGNFEYAVNQVLKASNSGDKNLFAKMYVDNKVLVIDNR